MSYRNVLEKASAKAIEFYESLDTRPVGATASYEELYLIAECAADDGVALLGEGILREYGWPRRGANKKVHPGARKTRVWPR